jgi:pilus assembly protein Flp/PilA
MKILFEKIQRFLVAEDGPTAVEYAVMLAMIVLVCMAAVGTVGTSVNAKFNEAGSSLAAAGS